MINKVSGALNAYAQALTRGSKPGLEPRHAGQAQDFAGTLANSLDKIRETVKTAEIQSTAAAAGKAELTHLVTAIANAELTLQTVVGVRDRAIQAYQEISRMPI